MPDIEKSPHSPALCEMALAHFNEPMLSMWGVVRCIGYGETAVDCYIIARKPGGQIAWLTCVGGYTFLDRLRGQGHVVSTSGEEWDDLLRLDNGLTLNDCPPEGEFLVDLRHGDMEDSRPFTPSPELEGRWTTAERLAKEDGCASLMTPPKDVRRWYLRLAEERLKLEEKSAQAYQVIGILLDRCGLFETEEGVRALDYFSNEVVVDEHFLPWPGFDPSSTADWPQRDPENLVERIARAWASMDGKVDAFDRENGMSVVDNYGKDGFTGHYAGYMEDAAELLRRAGVQIA